MAIRARRGSRRRPRTSDVRITDERTIKQAVAAAAIGNTMEWYDFGVFSYIAVVISRVFFPEGNATAQLLSTFATFAVAFIVRPFGGFFFGPLGDRIGRRKVLAITMVTMAAGTVAIGLIPDYATIGIWAPILLLVARLVQGFSTGGEYGGATTFVSEYAPDRRRGFMASWLEFGTLTGYSLGAAMVTMLTLTLAENDLLSWGWRVPFLIGGPLGLVGLYLRFRLEETPAYRGMSEERQGSRRPARYREVFTTCWRPLLTCIGLVMAFNMTNYMLTAYLPTYLTTELRFGHASSLLSVLTAMVLIMGLVVALGRYSDHIGRLPIAGTGSVALIVLSPVSFFLLSRGTWIAALSGILVLGLVLICFSSTLPSMIPALFPTVVRYGGVSIGYNIAVALFGGTTPLMSQALVGATGNRMAPAALLIGAGLVGSVAVYFTRESARRALPDSAPTAASREEAEVTAKEQREDRDSG